MERDRESLGAVVVPLGRTPAHLRLRSSDLHIRAKLPLVGYFPGPFHSCVKQRDLIVSTANGPGGTLPGNFRRKGSVQINVESSQPFVGAHSVRKRIYCTK